MSATTIDTRRDAISLMESVLRDGGSLAAEHPLVFQDRFGGRVVARLADRLADAGAEAGPHAGVGADAVVAACAVLPRTLVTPAATFPVGLVGSVATAPRHRGRGYGKEVVARAVEEAAATGAVCAMLWADDAGWYRDQGWIPVGTECIFVLTRGSEPLLPEARHARPATSADHAAIHRLYCTQSVRAQRSFAETSALLEGPGVRTLVATGIRAATGGASTEASREASSGTDAASGVDDDGDVAAYAALGRGADLRNVVHEWAGPLDEVLALVRAHLEASPRDSDGIYVMVPPCAGDMISFLEHARTPGARGILCMAKLASVEAAARLLDELTPPEVQVEVVDAATPRVRAAGPAGSIVLTGNELLLTLFPPRSDRTVLEVVERELGASLPKLPLEPFLWGLDSI